MVGISGSVDGSGGGGCGSGGGSGGGYSISSEESQETQVQGIQDGRVKYSVWGVGAAAMYRLKHRLVSRCPNNDVRSLCLDGGQWSCV